MSRTEMFVPVVNVQRSLFIHSSVVSLYFFCSVFYFVFHLKPFATIVSDC